MPEDASPASISIPALRDRAGLAMLRRVVATAQTVAHADAVVILLYEPASDRFVPTTPRVAVGLDERWLQGQGIEAAQTLAARAVAAGEVLDIPDTAATPGLDYPLLAGGRWPGAVYAAPLTVDGRTVGVLELYDVAPRTATVDLAVLRSFAELVGDALETAWGHERERSLRRRFELLDAASQAIAAELSHDQVLQRIVDTATAVVGARYGALGVVGPDGYLSDFITSGLSAEERGRLGPLPRGYGLLGVLIRQGSPLRVPEIGRDPRRVGFPPRHPPMHNLLGVPIRVHGELVGDLYLTDKIGALEFSDEDQRLLELLAAHAGIAIENARLHAQVRQLARQAERNRIARDLHDGIIQDIYAARLQLENLTEDMTEPAVQEQLHSINDQLSAVMADIRTYILGLQIRELTEQALTAALTAMVEHWDGRDGLAVSVEIQGEVDALPEPIATMLLQITREALANVAKHARAGRVAVHLHRDTTGTTLTVADNGQGFDPAAERGKSHHGLRNVHARAQEAGGILEVQSAPGSGTTLRVWIPSAS
jgi:signal transduction histidine kinase